LPALQVQANQVGDYSAATPGLIKLTEPILDTPISVDTITQQVIHDRGETTLNDVLRNAPGITLAAGEFNWEGNASYIRGFSARTDMFLDGMRDIGDYFRDPFDLEKVEVLEGPDSILFGRGSTGGVINQVTKKPELNPLTTASASFGTDDTKRLTADIDIPLEGLGAPSAARINAMGDSAGVAGRDVVHNDRYGFDGSLAWGLGTPTRLNLDYFHQSEDDQPDYGLPWYFGAPAPVARNVYYGYRDSDYLKLQADIVTADAEHDFGDDVTLHEKVRYANYPRDVHIAKAMEPAGLTTATPLPSIFVNINSYTLNSTEKELQNQTDLIAHFQTGVLQHDLVAGFEYDDESSDPNYYNSAGQPPKSLVTPDENQPFAPTSTYPRAFAVTTTSTVGVYAQDTIKLGEKFQAVLGLRWDSFAASFNATTFSVPPAVTGVVTGINQQHRVDQKPSPRVALVYKPVPSGTLYFSYGTSFDPTAEALNFINSGENFNVANEFLKPEENRNLEVGVKWQMLDDRLLLTGALFRSEKLNARIPDPNNPGFNVLAGDQRVDGFELQAQGSITSGWNITAGYDYLNSDTIKTVAGGPPLGFPLPFTPRSSATLWNTYDISDQFQVGLGGQYQGARYAQTTAPIERAPGYLVADAMAKYRFSEKFDIQVNVYNLADKYYYDLLHPAFVIPGAGRSAMLTLNYHY
jgi:catecholate siderophore receptor